MISRQAAMMAASPKRSSKRQGRAISARRSTSAKPARPPTKASPPLKRKTQVRSPGKVPTQEPARRRPQTPRKTAGTRNAGQTDAVLAAQLEAIAHGLQQISGMRTEFQEIRTLVEALARQIAALVANSPVQERGLDQPATAMVDEVLIVETDDSGSVSADHEEAPEPSESTPD
jgi:hypothetical protein